MIGAVMKQSLVYTMLGLLLCLSEAVGQETNSIKTDLTFYKTKFDKLEPIIVDVFTENRTLHDITRRQFSPISSSVGLPDFVFADAQTGKKCSIPPGLFGDNWKRWYKPVSGRDAYQVGEFILPAGKRIHLLHGDIRAMVRNAREYCRHALDEKSLLENPSNAATKTEYLEIVRFADQFLGGGSYDISVKAYSQSETVRIQISP